MKKIFNAPEIEIMHLGAQDIITTSVGAENPVPMKGTRPTEEGEEW